MPSFSWASEPAAFRLLSIDNRYQVGGKFGVVELKIDLKSSYSARHVYIKDDIREITLKEIEIEKLTDIQLDNASIMHSGFMPDQIDEYHICIPFGEVSYKKIGSKYGWYRKVFVVSASEEHYELSVMEPPTEGTNYISRSGCHLFFKQ